MNDHFNLNNYCTVKPKKNIYIYSVVSVPGTIGKAIFFYSFFVKYFAHGNNELAIDQ